MKRVDHPVVAFHRNHENKERSLNNPLEIYQSPGIGPFSWGPHVF